MRGLLPTPTSRDTAKPQTVAAREARGYGAFLNDIPNMLATLRATRGGSSTENTEKLLPTPLVGEGRHGSPNQAHGRGDSMLTGVVLGLEGDADDDETLLPTPCAQQSGNTPENHLAKKPGRKRVIDLAILVENDLLESGGELLPTPSTADGDGGHLSRSGERSDELLLPGIARAYGRGELMPTPVRGGACELLPTPMAHDAKGTGPSEVDRHTPGLGALHELLPTPLARDGRQPCEADYERHTPSLAVVDAYLPTPNASDCTGGGQHPDKRGGHSQQLIDHVLVDATQWGKYAPAIARWVTVTRPAPAPTEPNSKGSPRLYAPFAEWLMGWADGWCTDLALGLTRNEQLRIIGNGVVPQQAVAAILALARRI